MAIHQSQPIFIFKKKQVKDVFMNKIKKYRVEGLTLISDLVTGDWSDFFSWSF